MPRAHCWTSSAEQQALRPAVSRNAINGVGETAVRRPSPIYRHAPDVTPHGRPQGWFLQRTTPLDFGADDFCARCQACTTACPPQAIGPEKRVVRGRLTS